MTSLKTQLQTLQTLMHKLLQTMYSPKLTTKMATTSKLTVTTTPLTDYLRMRAMSSEHCTMNTESASNRLRWSHRTLSKAPLRKLLPLLHSKVRKSYSSNVSDASKSNATNNQKPRSKKVNIQKNIYSTNDF